MKAYKSKDGVARLFRPDKVSLFYRSFISQNLMLPFVLVQNMERMTNSARRLAFPVSPLAHLLNRRGA
jgi:hypothetical protein